MSINMTVHSSRDPLRVLEGLRAQVQSEPAFANLASKFYEKLATWIDDFDAGLDEAHEVGVHLVSFGQAVTFHLRDMGYWNPSLISFTGTTPDGDPVELIQHVSQISVLLVKLERLDPDQPKSPFGFNRGGDSESA